MSAWLQSQERKNVTRWLCICCIQDLVSFPTFFLSWALMPVLILRLQKAKSTVSNKRKHTKTTRGLRVQMGNLLDCGNPSYIYGDGGLLFSFRLFYFCVFFFFGAHSTSLLYFTERGIFFSSLRSVIFQDKTGWIFSSIHVVI